jgi:hypothetical protein
MNIHRVMTRRGLVEYGRNERGLPLTLGRVNKDIAAGIGPKPIGKYGPADLFDTPAADEYIDRRFFLVTEEETAA